MFGLEVLVVFAVAYAIQKHVMPIPVIGAYLPGGVSK